MLVGGIGSNLSIGSKKKETEYGKYDFFQQ